MPCGERGSEMTEEMLGVCYVCLERVTNENFGGHDDGRVYCTDSHKRLPDEGRVVIIDNTLRGRDTRIAELEDALSSVIEAAGYGNGAKRCCEIASGVLAGSGNQGGDDG